MPDAIDPSAIPSILAGVTVVRNPTLPKRTIIVSEDLYESTVKAYPPDPVTPPTILKKEIWKSL